MELLDIYDSIGNHTGTKDRAAVHKDGDWHKTFHCWVGFCDERGIPYVVLQQRSTQKGTWPGRFDIAAAGHYLAGETTEDGLREVKEELGVSVEMANLIPLGRRVCVEDFAGKQNHEFQDVFLLIGQKDLSAYKLDPSELNGLYYFPVEALIRLFTGEINHVVGRGIRVDSAINPNDNYESVTVTTDSFIPSLDQYALRAMIQVRAALRGEKYLHI